jgi:chemotaxis protein methyltransferase WspC
MAVRAQVPLRLASLGCATGAEAFSMAATAASVGRLGPDLRIVALDRNEAALRRAAAGRVSALGQRSPLPTWAGRWFEPTADGGLSLHADAMKLIDWSAADALTADLGGPFDVVMCRNLAIYLDASRRERLRERLADLVRPGGLLFVGHADPESIWHGAFRWLDVPGAFAFERVSAGERHPSRMVDHAGPTAVPLPPAEPAATASPSLDTIRAQADAGELDAAHAGVTRWLTQHPLQAEAWWLCAGIELAKGRSAEAANCLDRVLYLDPMHSLALLQSSELAERRGDRHAAERLRHRARRALAREEQA